jgi:uncharacterized protein
MTIRVARTRRERMRGLRGVTRLAPEDGLLIPRCRSVHTFGMRLPITVVYLDDGGRALEAVVMRPRRLGRPRPRARHVLELAADAPVATAYEIHSGPVEPVTVQVPSIR